MMLLHTGTRLVLLVSLDVLGLFFAMLATQLGGFIGSSADRESAHSAADPCSIPGLGRSDGEGVGYPLQYSWAYTVA